MQRRLRLCLHRSPASPDVGACQMWSVSVTLSKLLQLITQFPSFSTIFNIQYSFSFFFLSLFSFSHSHLAKKVVSACHSEMTLACHVCFLQTHVKEHFV